MASGVVLLREIRECLFCEGMVGMVSKQRLKHSTGLLSIPFESIDTGEI